MPETSATQISSFNGATLIQAWKRRKQAPQRRSGWLLQWSHAHSSVETSLTLGMKRPARLCFNGATLIQAWKPTGTCASSVPSTSFNGATLIQAWKPAGQVRSIDQFADASMEPRSFKRGNADMARLCRPKDLTLQWSHAHSSVETIYTVEEMGQAANGFNGATLIQAWKHLTNAFPIRFTVELQWSHAHSSVETLDKSVCHSFGK